MTDVNELTEADREQITNAAYEEHRKWQRGARGQMISEWDQIESWIAVETAAFLARRSSQGTPDYGLHFVPMNWQERGNKAGDVFCNTEVGQYCVGKIHGEIMVLRRYIENGQMEDETVGYGKDHSGGKRVAQADYEARIVSCFTYHAARSKGGAS